MGSSGAKKQIAEQRAAIEYQKQKDAQTRADLTPYREFGGQQLNNFTGWLNDSSKNPSSYLDPGYQFRRDQGNIGIANNAATAGLLQSGDTLRGLTQYGQGAASQEYNNAFNRYIGEGNFRQSNALMGQNAAVMGGQLANQGAVNVGNITSNTDFGAPDRIWGDVASGLGGGVGNAFSRRRAQNSQAPQTPGGSNIFGPPMQYQTDPRYMNMG
jgi:hypothetical protein